MQTCRDCVRRYVRARLEEQRFPIACPLCTVDDDVLTSGGKWLAVFATLMQVLRPISEINSSVLDELGLDEYEYARLLELELSVHSVLVTCGGYATRLFPRFAGH